MLGLFFALLLGNTAIAGTDCSMATGPRPECFSQRLEPVVKATIVAYGAGMTTADVLRIEKLFKERFESATEQQLRIEIVDRAVIDLKEQPRDFTDLRAEIKGDDSRRSIDRLTRLWYYYNLTPEQLSDEVHLVLKNSGMAPALAASDIVLVLSGPQFEGLGFADGGMGVTEQPSEVAWGASDGGSTSVNTDEKLVDELLHETGHLMGLDHASAKCFADGISSNARMQCCQTSPGRNDVMSYCRDRNGVRGPYYFRYTSCTKEYLQTTTVHALLNGEARPFQTQPCE